MARTNHGSFAERLAACRADVAALQAEMRRVEQAPIPRDEALARVPMLVEALSQRWTPVVSDLAGPAMPSVETILQAATSDPWTLGGVVASVAKDGMIATLIASLETHYLGIAAESCIPLNERPARLQALRTRLFEAECREEGVIVEAAAGGVTLDRRGDADPRAVFAVPAVAAVAVA